MSKLHRNWLPIIILVGLVVGLACVGLLSVERQNALVDTGETRAAVDVTVDRLLALHPAGVNDSTFREAVANARQAPYVAGVWVIDLDGQIVVGGSGTVQERATEQVRRVVDTLPADALSEQQSVALLAASAIQAEGEHNDVFRHLLQPIIGPDGEPVGFLGVAYDVNPWMGAPSFWWIAGILLGLAGLGVYWLGLPLWTYLDARERGERAIVWAIFVLIGNFVAFLAYLLSRTPAQKAAGQ